MLHVHRAARADYLAGALGDVLAEVPADPLQREVVSVPTRGVERWLAQELSHRLGCSGRSGLSLGPDGICANIDWPFPGSLVWTVVAGALGRGTGSSWSPLEDQGPGPWAPERAVWPLVQVIDEHIDDEALAPVADHLRVASPGPDGSAAPRRFAFARHVADLFDRYGVHRPEMLLSWAQGAVGGEGLGGGWAADAAWQSELWRLLRARIGCPSPAEDAQVALERLRQSPDVVDLPARLSCFGLTRLPAAHLRALAAVGCHRDVHLFLLHPSPVLWDRVRQEIGQATVRRARQADTTASVVRNPLSRSWGRDAREMQLVLAAEGAAGGDVREVAEPPATILGLVQRGIHHDRAPAAAGDQEALIELEGGDGSLVLHSCHGRARQVEVARDAVLHLLAADPSLEPRDVVMMCPDIEQFAPLVTAVFATASEMGAPEIRARLADRSVRQTNPMLAVVAHLLELACGRATASQLLDFASREPVRQRFGLDEDDLARFEAWLAGTGVRWGVDAAYRQAWKLAGLDEGTWQAGMERLALGMAMTDEDRLFAGVLPYEDVGSAEADLFGRVAELVNRLSRTLGTLRGRHSASGWASLLAEAAQLLASPAPQELWQTDQMMRVLATVAQDAGEAPGPSIDADEAQVLLADRLRGRPTRANFRTGDMTVCTLVPMRSVPHRVVCLLGMDDGVFPRHPAVDGDDLMLAAPMVGDRDAAAEDRQLLLDALLAATDHLVITYEGHDQHLNQPKPPCVPVAELLDAVDRTVRFAGGRTAREVLVVEHPLQPFDRRNYLPGRLGAPGPWRFDRVNLEAARRVGTARSKGAPFLGDRLEAVPSADIPLASLVRFVEHPVRAFLRTRLGFYPGNVGREVTDSLSLELAPLERWALGDRLLGAVGRGSDLDMAIAAELGRGLLPPGPLGKKPLAEISSVVKALLAKTQQLPGFSGHAEALELQVSLTGGQTVSGNLPRVLVGAGTGGATLVRVTYSKLAPKHRLRAWVQFLVLSVARPELLPCAFTVGQGEGGTPERPRVRVACLPALGRDADHVRARGLEMLATVVDLYDRGMREPLPLYCATSAAWAQECRAPEGEGRGPREAARLCWQPSNEDFAGESRDPENLAVLGGAVDFHDLLAEVPAPDEQGPGWDMEQRTRLGRLALRLWAPLLDHEQTVLP